MGQVLFSFSVLMFVIKPWDTSIPRQCCHSVKAGMDVPHGSMAAVNFFIPYSPNYSSNDSANLSEANLILLLSCFSR
jgi:hypothetical protein